MSHEDIRIAYVGPYPPIKGGVSQHGERIVRALREHVARLDVISWRRQYPRMLYPGKEAEVDGVPQTHFLTWWSPLSWMRARRRVKGVDLVLFQWITPAHALPLRVVVAGTTARKLAIVHNVEPHERFPFGRSAIRWVLGIADEVVAHSSAVARQIKALLPEARITLTPHPPNADLRPSPLPLAKRPRLLFFGFVRRYKGLELLLEALSVMDRRGKRVDLTVAGETWLEPTDFEVLAEQLGIRDRVDFRLGYVPDDAISELFADHHVVVQPYLAASQSGVIPLAFAAGRPVVVTPVGGLPEAVTTGVNGVVSAEVSAESVALAIIACLESLDELARGAARSAPDWAEVARVLLEVGTRGDDV